MYYVISKLGTQDSEIGVATSQTMEPGSWTDHGAVGIPANGQYNRIDPNWISIGGQSYLNFGSYWNDIFQIEMQGPLQAAAQESRNLAFNSSLNHREEGSFMFQNGNWFYLLFSAGIANAYTATYPAPGEEYSIRMCRSESGINGFVRFLRSLLALSTNSLF
jgi:arabinan endo-1,5-alpha-L-arabinosidase